MNLLKRLTLCLCWCVVCVSSYAAEKDPLKWRLLSPEAITTDRLFSLVSQLLEEGDLHSVWGWDATNQTWKVRFHQAPANNPYADLEHIEENQGYWFLARGTFNLGAGTEEQVNIQNAGWQLLGVNNHTPVNDFVQGMPDYATLWAWDVDVQQWRVYMKGDASAMHGVNALYGTRFFPLRDLESGQGFWINMSPGQTPTPLGGDIVTVEVGCAVGQQGQPITLEIYNGSSTTEQQLSATDVLQLQFQGHLPANEAADGAIILPRTRWHTVTINGVTTYTIPNSAYALGHQLPVVFHSELTFTSGMSV